VKVTRKILFCILSLFLISINVSLALNESLDEQNRERDIRLGAEFIGEYKFVEPPDINQRLGSYTDKLMRCPDDLSRTSIRNKINQVMFADRFADKEVDAMILQCEAEERFSVPATLMESEIEDCMNHLLTLLAEIDTSNYRSNDMLYECIKRQYFEKQVRENLISGFKENNISDGIRIRDDVILNKFSVKRSSSVVTCDDEECGESVSIEVADLPEGYMCEATSKECNVEFSKLRNESVNESDLNALLDNAKTFHKINSQPQVTKTVPEARSRFLSLLSILKNLFGFG